MIVIILFCVYLLRVYEYVYWVNVCLALSIQSKLHTSLLQTIADEC